MNQLELAKAVVDRMMSQDWFSQWLSLDVLNIAPGTCTLRMSVKTDLAMENADRRIVSQNVV